MKLSIIVPVYNGEKYLDRCLGSIAAQTVTDWELIIVNDGSTDDSGAIAERFAREHQDLNVRVVEQENRGQARSREKGMLLAAGEFVAFLDADDWVDAAYYELLLKGTEESDVDMAAGGITEEHQNGKKVYPNFRKKTGNNKSGDHDRVISSVEARLKIFDRREVFQYGCNKIYRRKLLQEINYPDGTLIGEDFLMVIQVLQQVDSIFVTGDPGYHYCIHGENVSRKGFGPEKRQGYEEYCRLLSAFEGSPEERLGLCRYLMLEYMSILLSMYRNKNRDEIIEREILAFVQEHRADYLYRAGDGIRAKAFALLINPLTSRIAYRIWPKTRKNDSV